MPEYHPRLAVLAKMLVSSVHILRVRNAYLYWKGELDLASTAAQA